MVMSAFSSNIDKAEAGHVQSKGSYIVLMRASNPGMYLRLRSGKGNLGCQASTKSLLSCPRDKRRSHHNAQSNG